ncbi:diguanylate cyclase [Weissella soli]|uniref:NADPH-dependent F420 reductase n=1 Tax=Weissella soli TaxID=155866 RepID=UPI0021BEF6A3|nr:NADPH-dependent F420 reductase [Weissella soli]MCT8395669.1 diguanylate cyclase [Weissella soli]
MANVTVFGQGNMGSAIGENFAAAGNNVAYVTETETVDALGEIVVLAVPYGAVERIISTYGEALQGKIVIDITNPVNFETFDDLVVPADSSAAAEIAQKLPESKIVKAFNTTFAATLATKQVGGVQPTTVLLAGDDAEAKKSVTAALTGSGLEFIDAGSLKRARELEAFGFLQISLAAAEKISWTAGFAIIK